MSVMFVGDVWCILMYEYAHTQETDCRYVCMHVRPHACMGVHAFVVFLGENVRESINEQTYTYVLARTRTVGQS